MKNLLKRKYRVWQIILIIIVSSTMSAIITNYSASEEQTKATIETYECKCTCHDMPRNPYPIHHPNGDIEYEHTVVDKRGWIHRKLVDSTEFEL